jgi:hypothetical protein
VAMRASILGGGGKPSAEPQALAPVCTFSYDVREVHEGAGSTEDWIERQRRPTSAAAPVEGPSVSG